MEINIDRINYLFEHPECAENDYEKGLVYGMIYFADKLVWEEQYYLDKQEARFGKDWTYPDKDGKKSIEMDRTMFRNANHIYQYFYNKTKGWRYFYTPEIEAKYNEFRRSIGLKNVHNAWGNFNMESERCEQNNFI